MATAATYACCTPVTTAEPSAESTLRRLRWQCRRGMKEMDLLLLRYLDGPFRDADRASRENFERLLAVEDDVLWSWLLGRSRSADSGLQALVESIRNAT